MQDYTIILRLEVAVGLTATNEEEAIELALTDAELHGEIFRHGSFEVVKVFDNNKENCDGN